MMLGEWEHDSTDPLCGCLDCQARELALVAALVRPIPLDNTRAQAVLEALRRYQTGTAA